MIRISPQDSLHIDGGMKWTQVVQLASNITPVQDTCTDDCSLLRSVFTNVSLVTVLTENYKCMGVLKRPIKHNFVEYLEDIQKGRSEVSGFHSYNRDIGLFVKHCFRQISVHKNATDLNVRHWANVSTEALEVNTERDLLVSLLCRLCHKYESLENALRVTLSTTISECSRLGYPCMGYIPSR